MELHWLQALSVAPAAGELLCAYAADLIRFNRGQNLVSRQDSEALISSLLGESVVAATALGSKLGDRCLDLGSGAGIPGIPTALIHPDVSMCLLERRGARCDFLRREQKVLDIANAEVLELDATRAARDPKHASGYDSVLAKAVAPVADVLELAGPFLRPGGCVVVFQGPNWQPDKWLLGVSWRVEGIELGSEGAGEPVAPFSLQVFHRK